MCRNQVQYFMESDQYRAIINNNDNILYNNNKDNMIIMIAILANTPNQAETLLHSLERATAGIGLHVNAHKTECMCYNQTGDISILDGTLRKLVEKFTNLRSSVSSTEKDIDTRLTKAWTAIDLMEIRPDR